MSAQRQHPELFTPEEALALAVGDDVYRTENGNLLFKTEKMWDKVSKRHGGKRIAPTVQERANARVLADHPWGGPLKWINPPVEHDPVRPTAQEFAPQIRFTHSVNPSGNAPRITGLKSPATSAPYGRGRTKILTENQPTTNLGRYAPLKVDQMPKKDPFPPLGGASTPKAAKWGAGSKYINTRECKPLSDDYLARFSPARTKKRVRISPLTPTKYAAPYDSNEDDNISPTPSSPGALEWSKETKFVWGDDYEEQFDSNWSPTLDDQARIDTHLDKRDFQMEGENLQLHAMRAEIGPVWNVTYDIEHYCQGCVEELENQMGHYGGCITLPE